MYLFLLRRQHRVPDSGRTSVFEAHPAEVELAFVDPAEQFDTGDHDCRRREPFETEHRTDAKFHTTVVCSIRLFRYFDERTFVSAGSWPSVFISRTARCDTA